MSHEITELKFVCALATICEREKEWLEWRAKGRDKIQKGQK